MLPLLLLALAADLPYTPSGELAFPSNYREWVFLSSGIGMTYGPAAAANFGRPPMFDNVYVNPDSYRAFLATGKWPDKTQFVLEIRNSEGAGSINKGGNFQTDLSAIEMNVKDSSSPNGEWAFYDFPVRAGQPATSGKPFPKTASCYQCHSDNTAVEKTFVQFYPTLYQVARHQGTVKPSFEKLPLSTTDLESLLLTQPWPKTEAALDNLTAHYPSANAISEFTLNTLGNRLSQSKKQTEAIQLLEWSRQKYPKSANIQATLAELYVASGNKPAARAALERTLQLLPADSAVPPARRKAIEETATKLLKDLE